jgi:TP901 family phage tail tape measure protein
MAFDITGQLNLRLASGAIRNIANEINTGLRGTTRGVSVPVRADMNNIRAVKEAISGAGTAMDKFAQQSGLAFKRFAAFSSAAVPFIAVASGIRSAVTQAIEFDREMVRLRQVSVESASEVAQVGQEVTRLATAYGVSSKELIKMAVTLKQADFNINETRDALEALAKSALAPNFDSMAQTGEGAIAVMKQFQIQAADLDKAIGSMNAVAGAFAVEAGDLIEAVRRTGGAFKATGGDLNQLLALFTSVRQTTRESAESIATGLRTIFTRIQRNDTVNALKEFGVNLRFTREEAMKAGDLGLTNQFVGAYEAIRRLSSALTQLPEADPRYSAIVEDLGGYRQISKVIPLIQQWSTTERALMVAEAGRVSLTVNASQATESYANRLTKLQESYLSLGRSLLDNNSFKVAFSGFESLAKGMLMVLEAAKPLLPMLTAMASAKIIQSIAPVAARFYQGVTYHDKGSLLARNQGGPVGFASGGMVPGVGDKDTVPASLPSGSYVVRKSAVQKFGAENLSRLGNKANVMLTPGEYVYTPDQAKKIGASSLNQINRSGKLPGYALGGFFDYLKSYLSSPSLPDANQTAARPTVRLIDQILKQGKDPNKEAKFQQYASRLQKEAFKSGNFADLAKVIPSLADTKVEYGVSSKPLSKAYGFVDANEQKNKVYITSNLKNAPNPLSTVVHEMAHVADLAAGRKIAGKKTGRNFLSNQEGTETNTIIKKLAPLFEKGLMGMEPDEFKNTGKNKQDYIKYRLQPHEILAKSVQAMSLENPLDAFKDMQGVTKKEQAQLLALVKEVDQTFRKEVVEKMGATQPKADSGPTKKVEQARKKVASVGKQITEAVKKVKEPESDPVPVAVAEPAARPMTKAESREYLIRRRAEMDAKREADAKRDVRQAMRDEGIAPVRGKRKKKEGLPAKPEVIVKEPIREILSNEKTPGGTFPENSQGYLAAHAITERMNQGRAERHKAVLPTGIAANELATVSISKATDKITGTRVAPPGLTREDRKRYEAYNSKVYAELKEARYWGFNSVKEYRDFNDYFGRLDGSGPPGKGSIPTDGGGSPPSPPTPSDLPPSPPSPPPPPPPKKRRGYAAFKSEMKYRELIESAMKTGNQIGAYSTEMPQFSGAESIQFLGELRKVGGYRPQMLQEAIGQNLRTNNPGMNEKGVQKVAAMQTTRIMKAAEQVSRAQERLNQVSNIRTQATSRAGDIDQYMQLSRNINRLQKRADFDPEAVAEAKRLTTTRQEIAKRIADNEGIDFKELGKISKSGRVSSTKSARDLLKGYRSGYESDARGAAAEEVRQRAILEKNQEKLQGIGISTSTDASGQVKVNFRGAEAAYGAGTIPPRANPNKNTLGKILNDEIQKMYDVIDPKGRGKNVSDAQKKDISENAKNNVMKRYVDSVSLQVQQQNQIKDIETARFLTTQKFEHALRSGAEIVVKNNRLLDAEALKQGYGGGLKQKFSNALNSTKGVLGNAFSSQSGFLGGQVIASYVSDALSNVAGSADNAAVNGREGSYKTARVLSGGLSGLVTGAQVGSAFGPLGAGIGAATGGLFGLVNSFKEAAQEISEAKIGLALKKTTDALSNFAKGTYALTPQNSKTIEGNFNTIDRETAAKSGRNTSYLFGLVSGSQENFQTELTKNMREAMAGQAASMMDALTKLVQEQAVRNTGNADIQDTASLRKDFEAALSQNGGIGSRLFSRVATATEQDPEMFRKTLFDMFQKTKESEVLKRRQQTSETDINRSAATFGGLSSAVEVATQRLTRMTASLKNVSDFMDGSTTPFSGSGLTESLQRPLGSDREDFMGAVRSITKTAGVAGGDAEKTADAVTVAGRLLPGIINAVRSQPVANLATGADMSVQIGENLRKGLAARGVDNTSAAMVTNMVSSQLGSEDFSKMLRETGQDMGKVIQKLLGPMAEPLKQSFTEIAKNLDERGRMFAEGLSELANRTRATGELMDKANMAEMASVRNRIQVGLKRRLISEDAADAGLFNMNQGLQQARQQRLTGFGGPGSGNPQFIASAMGGVFDEIRRTEEQIAKATKGGNIAEQNAAITQLSSLKTKAAELGQALKHLTDVSERTSQAQEKLSKIQSDREGRQALGLRYATANTEGRAEIASSFRLLAAAARMGTAATFSTKQQNQIFGLLSSLSPQMKLPGLGGINVKDLTTQLMKTTFGGAFDLDPQTAALERALDNFVQSNYDVAVEASRIQVEMQQKLQADFFSRLQAGQQTFINELSRAMMENQKLMRESLQMQAQSRLEGLEKQVGQSSMLGKIGVGTDDQFKALKDTLNDPKNKSIDAIFEAGKNQRIVQGKTDKALGNTNSFVDDIVALAGNDYARGTAKSDVSGILMNKFGDMGFTSAVDQKKLLSLFSESMDAKAGYLSTLSGNKENIAEAFRYAITTYQKESNERTNSNIFQAGKDLRNQGTIDNKIIDNLIKAAKEEGDNITVKTLRESVSAVGNTNKKFSELNGALDQARQQVQGFGEVLAIRPEGRANGGMVRYFNKGGWGSGGSLNPHSSDTVNARINPSEFVVAAGPAQRNKKLLEKINAGYADGGTVEEARNNIANAQKNIGADTTDIINPVKTMEAAEQARKVARANSEILFLLQLRNMKPDERFKFVNKQKDWIKSISGKETDEQLGIKNALAQLMSIEDQKNKTLNFRDLESYHVGKRKMGIAKAIKTLPTKIEVGVSEIYEAVKKFIEVGKEAEIFTNNVNDKFKIGIGSSLNDIIQSEPDLKRHLFLNNVDRMANTLNEDGALKLLGDIDPLRREFESLWTDTKIYAKTAKDWTSSVIFANDYNEIGNLPVIGELQEKEKRKIDTKILQKYYPPGIFGKIYGDALQRLAITSPNEFSGDMDAWAKKTDRTKKLGLDFDFEKTISALIDKAQNDLANQKAEGQKLAKANDLVKGIQQGRIGSLQTPEQGIAKIFEERNNAQFGPKQDMELMKLQLMAMEADAFNKLNPAVQTKLLEIKRRRILENKLSPAEQAQMTAMGLDKLINSTEDVTGDEIRGYAANRNKMTLIQRAALDVLMGKIAAQSQGKFNEDPDSLSSAEKAAYLIAVDAEGRSAALDEVNGRKNAMTLNRIGMWITSNPGAINNMLKKSEDKGPFGYAKDAALLEILASAYGAPTTLPKASDVFKDRSLKNKKQLDEAEKVKQDFLSQKENAIAISQAVLGPGVANGLIEAFKSGKGLLGFASGGLVPGVGNTDSVRANLPVGSYVVRKSSVQKLGADTLAALPRMARGGVVPAMVMPGEHIFTPSEASKIGKNNLDHINSTGKLPGYAEGGDVVINGVKYNLVPAGAAKWGGNRNIQMGFQPQTVKNTVNPLANNNNGNLNEQQFLAMEAMNQMIGGNGGITGAKAKFFSLRDELKNPRNRTKEKIAEFRQLYATLTNPLVAQMDAQRQMLGAQDAFASFQQDPKAFIARSKELRALAANTKASMEERVAAKEQLNQMNYAARFIDPRALRGAAAAAQKDQQIKQQQQFIAAGNDPLQGGLLRLNPALANENMASASNPVEAHNARVRANGQNKAEPNRQEAEANHLKKMLEIAQENYLKTGDPRYLQEINKIKNPEKVRAEEEAEAKRKMDDYRAKKQSEEHGNEIARWHVREGIEDIRDPGGVKRGAEKLRKFYAEKDKQRQEFEGRVFAHAPTYEENMPKMQKEWDEKNKGFVENRLKELNRESNERLNRNPIHAAMYARLADSPYLDKKDIVKRATGGIVPGVGSGDTVPALLEPGELVVPKRQVQKFANGGVVGGIQGFANGGMAQGGPDLLDVAARFNQAATQISQGLSGFSTSVSTFNGAVANFGTFVDKFDEAVGKIPGQIELSGANDIVVNLMGQDSIVKAVTEAIGPMIAQAIRDSQPVEQRAQ